MLVKEAEAADDDYLADWVGSIEPIVPGQTVDDMRRGPRR